MLMALAPSMLSQTKFTSDPLVERALKFRVGA